MSENKEKYFCHFGDLKVKDAEAREHLENLQEEVTNKQTLKEVNKNTNVAFWVGTEEDFENEADLTEATTICYVDTPIEEQIEETITEITDAKLTELTETTNAKLTELTETTNAKLTELTEISEETTNTVNAFDERLTNHTHNFNVFATFAQELINGLILYLNGNITECVGYYVVAEIEENVYEDTRITLPLTFYYSPQTKTCGWQGFGTIHCQYDSENSHFITCQIRVDLPGTYEFNENTNKYSVKLGEPILTLRDENVAESNALSIVKLIIKQIP